MRPRKFDFPRIERHPAKIGKFLNVWLVLRCSYFLKIYFWFLGRIEMIPSIPLHFTRDKLLIFEFGLY